MFQLPAGTLGAAVGVLTYTFICLITNVILIWLYWTVYQPFSYIALISYFTLIGTISSIIQQVYNYALWNNLQWETLSYIKAHVNNADVIFHNGNFGFMRILAILRYYCYLVEWSYVLVYCTRVTILTSKSVTVKRNTHHIIVIVGRIMPVVLSAVTIGLLEVPAVQSSFLVYVIVANVQAVLSCAFSIVMLSLVIYRYIRTKLAWKRLGNMTRENTGNFWGRDQNGPSSGTADRKPQMDSIADDAQGKVFDDDWVVVRLSIAVLLISALVVASTTTHLPQRENVWRESKADTPDLSAHHARGSITGYIPGVTPSLAIWIVFGFTKEFRQIMWDAIMPRFLRRKISRPSVQDISWEFVHHTAGDDNKFQLDDIAAGPKRRATLPEHLGEPASIQYPKPTRARARTEGVISQGHKPMN
ncbi:hypothetical protein GGR50DRAFT_2323 [Xylaria sp. CBS 124048]|nr:hypothetical protein GGR50DRAFT_2323 [Xylaria sp. CBS 124048]